MYESNKFELFIYFILLLGVKLSYKKKINWRKLIVIK